MILVIVGGLHLNFDRLLTKMDEIAPELGHRVVMQTGSSKYVPANTEWFSYESEERIEQLYDECDLLVCHAGAGTILSGLVRNKPIVTVPRRESFGEVTTDHQLMLADKIVEMGRGFCVTSMDDLKDTIFKALAQSSEPFEPDKRLEQYLSDKFENVEKRKKRRL